MCFLLSVCTVHPTVHTTPAFCWFFGQKSKGQIAVACGPRCTQPSAGGMRMTSNCVKKWGRGSNRESERQSKRQNRGKRKKRTSEWKWNEEQGQRSAWFWKCSKPLMVRWGWKLRRWMGVIWCWVENTTTQTKLPYLLSQPAKVLLITSIVNYFYPP